MIYWEYFLDENNFIKGWQGWNPERKIKDKNGKVDETENQKYQNKMDLIKDNPTPLSEMNLLPIKNGLLYNKEKNCNYQLINNEIIEIEYIPDEQEIFDGKYNNENKIRILTKALLDPNDSEVQEYKQDYNKIKEVK